MSIQKSDKFKSIPICCFELESPCITDFISTASTLIINSSLKYFIDLQRSSDPNTILSAKRTNFYVAFSFFCLLKATIPHSTIIMYATLQNILVDTIADLQYATAAFYSAILTR